MTDRKAIGKKLRESIHPKPARSRALSACAALWMGTGRASTLVLVAVPALAQGSSSASAKDTPLAAALGRITYTSCLRSNRDPNFAISRKR
jgi:hypothetical protein